MANDKSNKELNKSTMRVPSFNMILRQVLVVNAYGDKRVDEEINLENALFYNTVSLLNFSKDSNEVRRQLSYLLELTEKHDSYLVEEVLLDFVIGKGCTECSRAVCDKVFGKQLTFADMMRHHWFEYLMSHPAATEPYAPDLYKIVHDEAFYWHNFQIMLAFRLQEDNSLALEVLDYFAAKGDVFAMEHMALYYFSKCQFNKAFPLLKAVHGKMQTTEWDFRAKEEVTYKLAHLYAYGQGVEQDFDKATQYSKELTPGFHWGDQAKYLSGRIAEQRHDYWEAMYYYREIIDDYAYSRYSSYRDTYPNDLFARKLEVAFRNMKKKLYPMVDSLTLVTCQVCDSIELQIKVMMNARVAIEWGDGEMETIKWKENGWEMVNHTFHSSGSHTIT